MNIAKKTEELKQLCSELNRISGEITPEGLSPEKTAEIERLCHKIYKEAIALNVFTEVRKQFQQKEEDNKENITLKNQLEMDFFKTPTLEEPEILTMVAPQNDSTHNGTLNVGVNDKFRIIKELFEGSSQEYTIAINQFNTISHKVDAQNYFESLKNIYRWKEENNECLDLFKKIINRRFP